MKIAILSDIHSNLEALQAVLKDIKQHDINLVYCLGDVVGYGPNPRECLELIRDATKIIISGNHEQAAGDPNRYFDQLTRNAQAGIAHTQKSLAVEDIAFLSQLPSMLNIPEYNIVLAHGSTVEPHAWKYVSTEDEARAALTATPAHLCLVGHTHVPAVLGSTIGLFEVLPEVLELTADQQYLINVGSVGQPRDGDCRASYGLLEINDKTTTFILRRVFYDIGQTEQKIRQAGLPSFLSERLFSGA